MQIYKNISKIIPRNIISAQYSTYIFYLFIIYLNIDIHQYNQYKTITNNATLHLKYLHTSSPSIGQKRKTFMGKSKTFYYAKKTKSGVSNQHKTPTSGNECFPYRMQSLFCWFFLKTCVHNRLADLCSYVDFYLFLQWRFEFDYL